MVASTKVKEKSTDTIGVSFNSAKQELTVYSGRSSAKATEVLRDITLLIQGLDLEGGPVIRINGALSIPVAVAITSTLGRRYTAIAVYSSLEAKYVICATTNPDYKVGNYLD